MNQIFTANQMYIRKFPGMAARYLDRLGAGAFGLPAASRGMAAATDSLPRFEGAAEQWRRASRFTWQSRCGRK
jgi:hypothetical protein